jgi:hypothetical protein
MYKSMEGTSDFTSQIILLHNPQRDKTSSTSMKKIRNGGIGNYPNPKKIDMK